MTDRTERDSWMDSLAAYHDKCERLEQQLAEFQRSEVNAATLIGNRDAEIERVNKRLISMEMDNQKLRDIALKLWFTSSEKYCPICGSYRPCGHMPDCWLSELIREEKD